MLAGDISPIASLRPGDAFSALEYARDADCAFEHVLWLAPRSAVAFIAAGGFWTVWKIGAPWLVRFEHRTNVFNRAMFEAVEIRPLHQRGELPADALWFPEPPREAPAGPSDL